MIYLTLFLTFFKIGLFTLGGGYAMIPLIQAEVIDRHGWMTLEQFAEFVGIAESTPGPFAVNISTFCGITTAGFWGSLCATAGVVLPSVIIILLIASMANRVLSHWSTKSALQGAKPAVVGLLAVAAFSLAGHAFFKGEGELNLTALLLAAGLFTLVRVFKLGAITLILCGAAAGVALQLCGLSF
jgi:chromate transporter